MKDSNTILEYKWNLWITEARIMICNMHEKIGKG